MKGEIQSNLLRFSTDVGEYYSTAEQEKKAIDYISKILLQKKEDLKSKGEDGLDTEVLLNVITKVIDASRQDNMSELREQVKSLQEENEELLDELEKYQKYTSQVHKNLDIQADEIEDYRLNRIYQQKQIISLQMQLESYKKSNMMNSLYLNKKPCQNSGRILMISPNDNLFSVGSAFKRIAGPDNSPVNRKSPRYNTRSSA